MIEIPNTVEILNMTEMPEVKKIKRPNITETPNMTEISKKVKIQMTSEIPNMIKKPKINP